MVACLAPMTVLAQGRVTGKVSDASGSPLPGARVTVTGTMLTTGTDAQGQYTLGGVPAGSQQVRVQMLGFVQQSKSVTVPATGTVTADFTMVQGTVRLDAVVSTATGEQSKIELGNSISQIDVAARTTNAPVANMSDLLQAQAPGVQVLQSPLTGGGQRIRIRGTNSLSLNNEPIFVIDGVRMNSDNNSSSIGIGGTNPSRVSDLNPEEIESIEVVKGPSAATLYGTDAANGVIVVRTKRGRAGPARWSAYAEQGTIKDRNEYPLAYRGWRTGATNATNSLPTNATQCLLFQVAQAVCTQDSVTTFNLFDDPDATPNNTGYRQQYGLQVSGGSEMARYFVSGEWEDEVGQLKMPRFAIQNIADKRGRGPLDEQLRPNALTKTSVRANMNVTPTSKLDVAVSTGFISSTQRLPQTDNNTIGLMSNGLGGLGYKNNVCAAGSTTCTPGDTLYGYRAFTPDNFFSEVVTQGINRFIGSTNADYRPISWLGVRATAGVDFTSRVDTDLCRRDQCVPFSASYLSGFKSDNRSEFFRYTADMSATGTFNPTSTLQSRTTGGIQWVKAVFDRNGAYGENLPPGSTQLDAGTILAVSEVRDESKTLGYFVEEQLTWRDRLFLTGALRMDDNSAFGTDFDAVVYPKLSGSWVASDESFFPQIPQLSSLRFRAAVGASGTQPGPQDAIPFYATATLQADAAAAAPAVVFSAIGNPTLQPERATEMEGGFDVSFMQERVSAELTYYSKLTRDALVARTVAPSAGAAVTRFENVGSVKNAGLEYSINYRVLDRSSFGLDLGFSGSTNANKLVELGEGVSPIVGATRQQRPGYPLDGFWMRQMTSYSDLNGDGIISYVDMNADGLVNGTEAEITVTDTAVFIGDDKPKNEMVFNVGADFLQRRLRLNALVDRKSGHYLLNGTERIRCESRNNCDGLVNPNSSAFEQARAAAVRNHPARTQGGYTEKADFTRLREIGASYTLPDSWAAKVRARSATFTAAARNVKIWTKYTGLDPESNYFEGARGTVSDFQTAPPPSYFTFRINLGL